MIFWVSLVAFGVPLIVILNQVIVHKRARANQLKAVQDRIAEKNQEAIDHKLKSMKDKGDAKVSNK